MAAGSARDSNPGGLSEPGGLRHPPPCGTIFDVFGNEQESDAKTVPATPPESAPPEAGPVQELSPAAQRFQSCRWRKAAESGVLEHCTHRDVQPIAGTAGFNAESWCPDCGHYKVRRNPRKRPLPSSDDGYYY
jgi:hypothetical protein